MRPASNHLWPKRSGPIFLISQQSPAPLCRQVYPLRACTAAHLMQRRLLPRELSDIDEKKVPRCLLLQVPFSWGLDIFPNGIQAHVSRVGSKYEALLLLSLNLEVPYHLCSPNPPPCWELTQSLPCPPAISVDCPFLWRSRGGSCSVDMDTCTLGVNLHGGGWYGYSLQARILILLYYLLPPVSLALSHFRTSHSSLPLSFLYGEPSILSLRAPVLLYLTTK